jgi:hypothetical protein
MLMRVLSAMVLAPVLLLAIFMYIVGERKVENGRIPAEIRRSEPLPD